MLFTYLSLKFFTKYEDVQKFSFKGIRTLAYVSKVYDGDTVTVIFKYKGQKIKTSCRLLGIDTPELKSQNPDEKQMAIKLRDILANKILNKIKYVVFHDFDKYGRPLVELYDIFSRKKSINDFMGEQECVNTYFGGTKKKFDL